MTDVFAPQLTVTVDGRNLPHAAERCIDEVVVEDHLHLPAMFALRFRTDDDRVPTEAGLRMGSKVAITLRGGTAGGTPVVEAEVTGIEATLGPFGSHLVVRGYDAAHRLHRAPITKGWNNVTDSDVANAIAGSHGLAAGRIDATTVVHTHLAQLNATDWEFLRARAREIGYEISVRGGRLDFVKATTTVSRRRRALTMGEELLTFAPRISSATQVTSTRVRSWDPTTKAAIIGTAPAKTGSARLSTSPAALASGFGSPTHVTVDRPVASQSEADLTAHAVADSLASTFVEAEGVARGDPGLRAGTVVKIDGSGKSFDGEYTLTSTRHVWDTDEGYLTHLVISGRQDRSLLGLATVGASAGPHSGGGPPINGMVVGVVTNAKDPDSLARVKLKFPWLADDYESDWVPILQAGAGAGRGLVVVPEVNDEVLVAFDHGDVRRPYVLGSLYNGQDKPGLSGYAGSDGSVAKRGFVSRTGHTLVFLDDEQAPGITLTTNKKLRIELKDADTTVHISSEGKVLIEGKGDVAITATGALSLKSQDQVNIEGATVSVKAQGAATLEAQGEVGVKGAIVRIN